MSVLNKLSIKENIWTKVALILFITLLLMIPVGQVEYMIHERHAYGVDARNEVAQKWSNKQSTGAVVLSVPVIQKRTRKNEKGETETYDHHSHIHFLPEDINIEANTESVIRHRGIYRVPLYVSQLKLSGYFPDVKKMSLDIENTDILWKKAELNLGIDEVRGLKEVSVKWNDRALKRTVGKMLSCVYQNAVKAKINLGGKKWKKGANRFLISLTLRGSEALEFFPFGQTTKVEMASNWGDPSFDGAFLPDQYEIGEQNFTASWKVLGLNRNLPPYWIGGNRVKAGMDASRFGVRFHMPLQNYQLNTRSVKYSFLFVALTFITLFFIEIIFGLPFHPMHYAMTGAGLSLFYLLLLSFSEHIGFGLAYGVAGAGIVLTVSLYVLGVTKVKKGGAIVFSQLSLLYGFLYILLQQEEYTLVVGASGLWIVLVFVMYITRRIDWFNLQLRERTAEVKA